MNGTQYVALVAALSSLLSENLDAENTLILAELLNQVSDQLLIISAFKATEEERRKKAGANNTLAENLVDAAIIDQLT
ncbi:hypothetical protein DRA42_14330 [Ethanoligenens harbinense]|nr:hypothetical protein CXQ68_14280 [Ethanoligenens harbinense YUAN-3]AYF39928.1 hypothetical protein CXP51_14180 [Ethanoligenens harbinense]AYF42758.1 hypothetical protein CN246_14760 [Ethanoligenens harbinense]QCN93508.1 hypothetical protein DRA42_14330 [Ethanoligenens harbinense]